MVSECSGFLLSFPQRRPRFPFHLESLAATTGNIISGLHHLERALMGAPGQGDRLGSACPCPAGPALWGVSREAPTTRPSSARRGHELAGLWPRRLLLWATGHRVHPPPQRPWRGRLLLRPPEELLGPELPWALPLETGTCVQGSAMKGLSV